MVEYSVTKIHLLIQFHVRKERYFVSQVGELLPIHASTQFGGLSIVGLLQLLIQCIYTYRIYSNVRQKIFPDSSKKMGGCLIIAHKVPRIG
jgi:hypothetical protein